MEYYVARKTKFFSWKDFLNLCVRVRARAQTLKVLKTFKVSPNLKGF